MTGLDSFLVVLDRPQNPLNMGAVVRAVKNMGFGRLRMVNPAPYARDELLRVAHHAEDVVDRIEIVHSLEEGLADAVYVVGTAAVKHPEHRRTYDVRGLAADLLQRSGGGTVALLFGAEADGLDLAALDRCHVLLTLPTDPAYPALNLAQSVLLVLYELRMAALQAHPPQAPALHPAEQAHLERLFTVTEEALGEIGFFTHNPGAVMRSLRQMAYRAGLTSEEVALLLAMARQVQRKGREGKEG